MDLTVIDAALMGKEQFEIVAAPQDMVISDDAFVLCRA
jgi:hypothetical protein